MQIQNQIISEITVVVKHELKQRVFAQQAHLNALVPPDPQACIVVLHIVLNTSPVRLLGRWRGSENTGTRTQRAGSNTK